MGHLAPPELQLHPDLIPPVKKLFGVPDFGQIIVVIDVYPEFDLLQFGPSSLPVFLMFGDVVAEFSEIDDLANRWNRRGRDFDQIQAKALSFAEGV